MSHLFSGIGQTKVIFKSNLIGLLIFLPLAPVLLYTIGVLGLIYTLIISTTASNMYYVLVARELGIVLDVKSSLRIYVVSSLTVIPAFLFFRFSPFDSILNLITSSLIFLSAYLILLPLVGAVNSGDLEAITVILGKNKISQFVKPVLLFEAMIIKRISKKGSEH